ncbi:hypothetical protein CLG96_12345 [Sphingomonas oleivorans]|uniref:Uncharacterized protein n=1 Tax=Sphingomonas oleivorans TaxID=1735121 RepID=A0A2T5FVY7_9SPHN|nr:hypothetical protein [Sphingomonas oleivorans]PTQ09940.1 hypothetical protein CLG96_12345 [Sphingomonas oleivorans]
MEEARAGQHPLAEDHIADDKTQSRTLPLSGHARGGAGATAQDLALLRDAEHNAERSNRLMKRAGFGDHKGVEGF